MTKNNLDVPNELKQLAETIQNKIIIVSERCNQSSETEPAPQKELEAFAALIESYQQTAIILQKIWPDSAEIFTDFFGKLPVYIVSLKNYVGNKDQRSLYKLQVIGKSLQKSYLDYDTVEK